MVQNPLERKKVKKKSKKFGITAKSKKKSAIARAIIKAGNGKIKINHHPIETVTSVYVREFLQEPLILAGDLAKKVDIDIKVQGSGFMSQAVAARACIAKALIEFSSDEKLKNRFLSYDRLLLVDDPRRVESKKPLGTKARKKKQKSKR